MRLTSSFEFQDGILRRRKCAVCRLAGSRATGVFALAEE